MFDSLVEMMETNKSKGIGVTFILNEQDEKFVSYNDVYEKALCMLSVLQSKNIKQGEEVILQVEDAEKFIYSLWACLLGGIVPIPISVGNTYEQKLRIFKVWELLEHPHMITTEDVWMSLENFSESNRQNACSNIEINREDVLLYSELEKSELKGNIYYPQLEDVAIIMFSSGSTGEPKGVKTTHKNIIVVNEDLIDKFNVTTDDVSLHWMPLTHMVGIVFCHLLPLMTATQQVLMDKRLYFQNPLIWFDKICEYKATMLLTANFGMKHFLSVYDSNLNMSWDLSHIKLITLGGEALSVPLIDEFVATLQKYGMQKRMMSPVYGITEAMVAACVTAKDEMDSYCLSRQNLSIGSNIAEEIDKSKGIIFAGLGKPPKRCNVRICDNNDEDLGMNVVGNILVSGPNVMPGYYLSSQDSLVFTENGWYRTGDIGFVKDGEVFITGRAKEMVIVNMVNYFLFDIERTVESVEGIIPGTVAACGIQDSKTMGDEVFIFIQFKQEVADFIGLAKNIRHYVKNRIGLEMKSIIPLIEIPRTVLGKVNRSALEKMYNNGAFDSIMKELDILMFDEEQNKEVVAPKLEVEKILSEIVIQILGVKSVKMSDNFFDLGGQSIKVMELATQIQNRFNITISLRAIYENPQLKSIAENIESLLK